MSKAEVEQPMTIELPTELVATIKRYNKGDLTIGSIASLNLVAFIGEQVAAIVAEQETTKEG